jgi:hypothetical protein
VLRAERSQHANANVNVNANDNVDSKIDVMVWYGMVWYGMEGTSTCAYQLPRAICQTLLLHRIVSECAVREREREIAEAYPMDVAMSQSMSQSRQVWGNISHGPRIVLFLATALAVLSLSRYLYRYLRVRLYSTSGPAARMVLIPTLIIPVLIAITTAQSSMVGGGPR